MLINKIKLHPTLAQFVEETCCENDVCVTFEMDISPTDYAIIKVDKYYNSLNIATRPASIDCLIVRKCIYKGYGLTLVELKKADTGKGFTIENIKEKFQTTLFDFIKRKFTKYLDLDYTDIKLLFVTNNEIYKRDLGLKMKVLMNIRYKFNGKNLMITPKMPNPTIKNCY